MMHTYNYFRDRRVVAALQIAPYDAVYDEPTMLVAVTVDDGSGQPPPMAHYRYSYAVCGTCSGRGTVVDPTLDASGFAPRDAHALGHYLAQPRMICPTCHSRRVVPCIDWRSGDAGLAQRAQELERDAREMAQTWSMELALGC